MKNFIIATIGFLFLSSCQNEETPSNPATTSKIYFDDYNQNIGASGIKWDEIYSVNLDGTNQQQLTNYSNNGTIDKSSRETTLNGDKTKIIFTSNKDNFWGELFLMNLDGTGVTRITDNSGNGFGKPFVFQNGTKLSFDKEGVDPVYGKYGEIYISNIDASNQIQLTTYPTDGNCQDASVNASNTSIVYSCGINGIENQIYTMSINGANKQLLTTNNTLHKAGPKYSPNGTKIVFEGRVAFTVNKHSEIFIMNADGTNIVQLTNYSLNGVNGTDTEGPIFSNDGALIYYTSDESGIGQIYKMNIDGTGKTKLTTTDEDKSNPTIR